MRQRQLAKATVTESPPAHTPPEASQSSHMSTPEPPDSSATGSQDDAQQSPSINAADEKSTHISTPLDAWIDKLTEF